MAELIREVSGNELDATFVQMYLDYVEAGRNGGILKWDISKPYEEGTRTMNRFRRLTKESDGLHKMTNGERSIYVDDDGIDAMKKRGYWLVKDKPSPYFQDECQMTEDSSDENITADIKDVERMYGADVANGLLEYCRMFKKSPGQVMNDLSEDGNGQTEWDKFDNWLQKKKGIDFTGGFGDYSVDDEIKRQRERERETEVDADEFERKMAKTRRRFGAGKPKRRYVSRNRFK